MPNLGPGELIVILVIALLVLGPKRLPEAGRSVGKGIREFKEAITGKDDDDTIAKIGQHPHDSHTTPKL
jgi:sec-independent protein translocase protein TatA